MGGLGHPARDAFWKRNDGDAARLHLTALLVAAALISSVIGCAKDRENCCYAPTAACPSDNSGRLAYRDSARPQPDSVQAALAQTTAPLNGHDSAVRPASHLQPEETKPEELPPATEQAAPELTLDQAIELCLLNDPRLRAGFEAIRQANADSVTASLKPNPNFFTDGQLLQLAKDFTPQRQGGPPQQDFQLGYPIDWFMFGKRAAAMVSATQAVYVSQAEYENLIRERVTSAALAFYDVVEADGLLRLTRQDSENLEQITTTTEKSVAAGGRPQMELNRIRLALAASRRAQREAQANSTAARARLSALTGGALTQRPFSVQIPNDQPMSLDVPPTEDAYALALANRPDLNALRWRVEQARSAALVEERKKYPEITMTFGYTRQYQLHTIGFPDADSWSTALAMPLPLCDRNQGNRMRAQSVVTQNRFELEAGELELWSEIESVIAALTAARDNAAAIQQSELALADQVLESMRQSYAVGGRTLLDLLDAQRNYRETYRALTTTRANYGRARVRFQSAIGQRNLP